MIYDLLFNILIFQVSSWFFVLFVVYTQVEKTKPILRNLNLFKVSNSNYLGLAV